MPCRPAGKGAMTWGGRALRRVAWAAALACVLCATATSATHTLPHAHINHGNPHGGGLLPRHLALRGGGLEEGVAALTDPECVELDFTHHVELAGRGTVGVQAALEEVEAEFGLLPKVGSQHVLRKEDLRRQHAELSAHLVSLQASALTLFDALSHNKTLQRLRVDCKNLGDDSGDSLAKALAKNASILELNIASNCLTSNSAVLIGVELRHHPIQELYFDFNQIRSKGADQLAAALQGNKELRILSLKGNGIGPDFPRALLWLLAPRPESSGGRITDEGANTRPLRSLRLEFNHIETLPLRLGTVSACIIGLTENPLMHPPPSVVALGWEVTFEVLRKDFLLSEEVLAREVQERKAALENNLTSLPWLPVDDLEGVTADDL